MAAFPVAVIGLLSLKHYAAAYTASIPNINDVSSFGAMGSRDMSAPPEFSAHWLHGFEGHNWKRQASEIMDDTELHTEESWYWGPAGNPIANVTGYADTDTTRFLSMERFSDVISSTQCSGTEIKVTFRTQVGYAAAQDSWTWMNQDGRHVYISLEAATSVAFGSTPASGQPIGANSTNSTNSLSSGGGARTVTIQATKSTWKDSVPNGHFKLDTRGLFPESELGSMLGRRQDVVGDASSIDLNKANVQNRRLINFDPRPGGKANEPPAQANNDQPPEDGIAEANREPFYLECKFCGLSGSADLVNDSEFGNFAFLGGDGLITGSADIIPRDLAAKIELEVGLKFEVPLPNSVNVGEVTLGTIVFGPGIPFGPITIGPQLQLTFGAEVGPIEGRAGISVGGEIKFSNDARGRIDFGETQNRESTGWEAEPTLVGPSLNAEIDFNMVVGPKVKALFGISTPLADAVVGIQVAAPAFNMGLLAGAGDPVCDGQDIGIKAQASLSGEVQAVLELGPINIEPVIAKLFNKDLANVCLTPGGDGPLGDDGQPLPAPSVRVLAPSTLTLSSAGFIELGLSTLTLASSGVAAASSVPPVIAASSVTFIPAALAASSSAPVFAAASSVAPVAAASSASAVPSDAVRF